MVRVALVGLVDGRGRVLLQERDELAPTDPDRWSLVGGAVEEGELAPDGARRELLEETGIGCDDLVHLTDRTLACPVHGSDDFSVFTAATDVPDDQVECHEGRQIVFVHPERLPHLDLTAATATLLPEVLAAHRSLGGEGVDLTWIEELRRTGDELGGAQLPEPPEQVARAAVLGE